MNIDKMEAGRELDALVAERVMGLDVKITDWKSDRYGRYKVKHYRVGNSFLPEYSTDISAAWTVIEKMINLDYGIHMGLNKGNFEIAIYPLGDSDWIYISAPTAPLAICKAALKSLEE